MPNPFIRLGGGANQSHQPPERPQAETPVLEHVRGEVFAYRGMEDHGVAHGHAYTDVPGYDGTRDAVFELEPPEEHVIPVRVVHSNDARSRFVLRTHVVPITVGGQPVLLAGQNDRRGKLFIKGMGNGPAAGDVLWIADTVAAAGNMQGYPLTLNATPAEFATAAQNAVYGSIAPLPAVGSPAGSAAGTVIAVFVAEEVALDL